MSSVYFPAHVVVLFKRLVNVVSTISISNQYVLHCKGKAEDSSKKTHSLNDSSSSLLYSTTLNRFTHVEWPGWMHIKKWERILTLDEDRISAPEIRRLTVDGARSTATVLKATLNLPSWIPENWVWPRLLFSEEIDVGTPSSDDSPHPNAPPNRGRAEENRKGQGGSRKMPRRDPLETFTPDLQPPDTIHQLLLNPALYDPIRTPRYPIVLCHGLYGFDSRGPSSFPSLRMHYWSNVLHILRGKIGADVIVTSVPGTGSISSRSMKLHEQLLARAHGRGVNFLAHSMGGLDCRYLISRIRPKEYVPLSLTSISTPHRGSPFMDWCSTNIGIGKLRQQEREIAGELLKNRKQDIEDFSSEIANEESYECTSPEPAPNSNSKPNVASSSSFSLSLSSLPSTFTTLLLSIVDSPAYANLASNYLNDVFNPSTPDDPHVKYWSVAGRMSGGSVNVWHPFWLPKMVLDAVEEKERERLKKIWEEENGQNWGPNKPLWADERQWGNDGLVTVQSAKWGEFLGVMEGCDHWEMRGARGIEFGVDLPAIPAIGLGSSPLPTSSTPSTPASTSQGDGWGFGEWTRFVGAWKKSKDKEVENSMSVVTQKESSSEKLDAFSEQNSLPSGPSSGRASSKKDKRVLSADDHLVKSSTDTLSAVFDWLINRVPAPSHILRVSSSSSSSSSTKVSSEDSNASSTNGKQFTSDKDLSTSAMTYAVGVSSASTSGGGSGSSVPPSEMKRRMEREDRGRKRNELASKDDLERFYVALARTMYDAGL